MMTGNSSDKKNAAGVKKFMAGWLPEDALAAEQVEEQFLEWN